MTNTNTTSTPTTPPGQPPAPRKRHRARNGFLIGLAALGAVIAGISAAGGGSSPSQPAAPASSPPAAAPASPAPAAAPAQPAEQARKVTFVVTGNVPASQFGSVDITYGSDSATHDVTFPNLDSQGATFSMPFDPSAQYYSVQANFTGSGTAKVKIIVSGRSMHPTVVAHGSASATDNGTGMAGGLASAQAAPNDSTGVSWTQE